MGHQLGEQTTCPLDVSTVALVNAIVHPGRLQSGRLGLEPGHVVGIEQIGQHQVSLYLYLANPFAQTERRPVALIYSRRFHKTLFSVILPDLGILELAQFASFRIG